MVVLAIVAGVYLMFGGKKQTLPQNAATPQQNTQKQVQTPMPAKVIKKNISGKNVPTANNQQTTVPDAQTSTSQTQQSATVAR